MRALFDPGRPLGRSRFIAVGLALAALKYAVDLAVIYAVTGIPWTPLDYLVPLLSVRGDRIAGFPAALDVFLLLWTLPFLGAGVILTVRRARDAAVSPWIVVFFFAPILNYLLILLLALLPSSPEVHEAPAGSPAAARLEPPAMATLFSVAAGLGVALVMVGVSVLLLKSYGMTLFLGTPFVMAAVTAYVASRSQARTRTELYRLGLLTLAVGCLLIVGVALEGVICIVMALPIAIPLALLGAFVGGSIGAIGEERPTTLFVLVALLPLAPVLERVGGEGPMRVVSTAVEIAAPPQQVWQRVVSFPDIDKAPGLVFRLGLAYPIRARIDGAGPGAMRTCEFSTGVFREPITAWDEPRLLAFDVVEQAPPLRELSPYAHVYAPHITGFFRTSHGEFHLTPLPGGRTRLEGRTWYALRMTPSFYWTPLADTVVHAIHRRVLEHVKDVVER